jgi:hypothetical protein
MLTMPIPFLIRRIPRMRSLKRYPTLRPASAPSPGLLSRPLKAPVHTTAASAETVVWISVAGLPVPGGSRPVIAGIASSERCSVSPVCAPEKVFRPEAILAELNSAAAFCCCACERRRPARLPHSLRRRFGQCPVPAGEMTDE